MSTLLKSPPASAVRPRALPHAIPDSEQFVMASARVKGNYEISVALPASYATGNASYPVLIVLDGNICFGIAADTSRAQAYTGEAEEIIVVGVSIPRTEGLTSYSLRRLIDFTPVAPDIDRVPAEMRGLLQRRFEAAGMDIATGMAGGMRFRDFLVDELLARLAADYRIKRDEVGLFGHSAGGAFAAWCLLQNTPAFSKYIVGSYAPTFDADPAQALASERSFAARHGARAITVLTGAGGTELEDPKLGALFKTGLEQMQRLRDAKLPGLDIQVRLYEKEGHASMMAVLLASGIRALWGSGKTYSEAMKARA